VEIQGWGLGCGEGDSRDSGWTWEVERTSPDWTGWLGGVISPALRQIQSEGTPECRLPPEYNGGMICLCFLPLRAEWYQLECGAERLSGDCSLEAVCKPPTCTKQRIGFLVWRTRNGNLRDLAVTS
jgi:hypothetical protein